MPRGAASTSQPIALGCAGGNCPKWRRRSGKPPPQRGQATPKLLKYCIRAMPGGGYMTHSTKIERVETILWQRWLLVRIYCEDGTVGIGEGGVHGWQRPTKTMVEVMTPYLLGKDPHRIEHHYQFLYRSSHFMGAVVQGALSAIDIALWDIKGKRLGVPIYDLMGGKTRQKVRCCIHVRGNTLDTLVQDAIDR